MVGGWGKGQAVERASGRDQSNAHPVLLSFCAESGRGAGCDRGQSDTHSVLLFLLLRGQAEVRAVAQALESQLGVHFRCL